MILLVQSLLAVLAWRAVEALQPPVIGGCNVFPADSWWNTPIDNLPTHQYSTAWVNTIGRSRRLKADFGEGLYDGQYMGIPFIVVPSNQPLVPINYVEYGDQSDPGPWPIPLTAPIEGDPNPDDYGDRHVIVLRQGTCELFELYQSFKRASSWDADSGAKWNLNSNAFRPLGWTSADAAGLPILPGLVRYEEVAQGEIRHAIRFTAPITQQLYVWPATHLASRNTSWFVPPMGARFRLKSDFDISGFSTEIQVILRALKKYGLVLADNGSSWYMSGSPNNGWSNDMLNGELMRVLGQHFEAVDVSSLMLSSSSGQVNPNPVTVPPTTGAPSITKSPSTTKSPTTAAPSTTKAPTTRAPTTKAPTKTPTPAPVTPATRSPTRTPTKRPTKRRRRRRGLLQEVKELA